VQEVYSVLRVRGPEMSRVIFLKEAPAEGLCGGCFFLNHPKYNCSSYDLAPDHCAGIIYREIKDRPTTGRILEKKK
jgi:hypothetical protein